MTIAAEVPEGLVVAVVVALFGLLGWLAAQQFSSNGDLREIKTTISSELRHNGGGSMKDVLHDLQKGHVMLARQIEELHQDDSAERIRVREAIRVAAEELARTTEETFKRRDKAFLELAAPYVEEIAELKLANAAVLARLDELGNQGATDIAKVIGKIDSNTADIIESTT